MATLQKLRTGSTTSRPAHRRVRLRSGLSRRSTRTFGRRSSMFGRGSMPRLIASFSRIRGGIEGGEPDRRRCRPGNRPALYDTSLIPLLPGFIEQLRNGDTAVLDTVGAGLLGTAADAPRGSAASVTCAERGSTRPTPMNSIVWRRSIRWRLRCWRHRYARAWTSPRWTDRSEPSGAPRSRRWCWQASSSPRPHGWFRDVSAKLGPASILPPSSPGVGHGVLGSGSCATGLCSGSSTARQVRRTHPAPRRCQRRRGPYPEPMPRWGWSEGDAGDAAMTYARHF